MLGIVKSFALGIIVIILFPNAGEHWAWLLGAYIVWSACHEWEQSTERDKATDRVIAQVDNLTGVLDNIQEQLDKVEGAVNSIDLDLDHA